MDPGKWYRLGISYDKLPLTTKLKLFSGPLSGESMQKKQSKSSVKTFFDEDAGDYFKFKYRDNNESFMSLRHRVSLNLFKEEIASEIGSRSKILDAGCGPGLFLRDLLFTSAKLYGLDMSNSMLNLAKSQFHGTDQTFALINGDIEMLPFKDNSFDLILSLGVIEYLDVDKRVLSEFHRCLKLGGHLLIAITNRYSYNLAFDALIEFLKNRESTSCILSKLKERSGLGKVKRRDFRIRKHSPTQFGTTLKAYKFQMIRKVYFGLNAFPYPINYLVPRLNRAGVTFLMKTIAPWIRVLSEGCIFLCKTV